MSQAAASARSDGAPATRRQLGRCLLAAGGRLYSGCRVERVLTDGRGVSGVVARFRDPESGRAGPRLTVRARVVVLACSAIQNAGAAAQPVGELVGPGRPQVLLPPERQGGGRLRRRDPVVEVFPGPIGVSPQITIMALATRTGRHILENTARYFS